MREPLLKEYYDAVNALFPEFDGFCELLKYSDWSPWFFFDRQKRLDYAFIETTFYEELEKLPLTSETRLRSILEMSMMADLSRIARFRITAGYNPVKIILQTIENFPIYTQADATNCEARLQVAMNIIDECLDGLKISTTPISIVSCRQLIADLRGLKITLVTPNTRSGFSHLRKKAGACREKILQLARALPQYIKTKAVKEIGCGEAEWKKWMKIFTGMDISPDFMLRSAMGDIEFLKNQITSITRDIRSFKAANIVKPGKVVQTFEKLQKGDEAAVAKKFKPVVKNMPTYSIQAHDLDIAGAVCYQACERSPGNTVVIDPNDEISTWELQTLALHEGDPGHSFQMQYMIDRGLGWHQVCWRQMAGFLEGWAHYAEMLGRGGVDLGALYFGLFRAARVAIDVGIHCKGWTQKEAENFLRANTLLDESRIKNETMRYICMPGQASTYWLGRAVIMACLEKFEGDDIRDFHDKILGGGVQQLNTLLESFGAEL